MEKSNLWIGLTAGVVIYFIMMVYSDYNRVLLAISTFQLKYIPVLLSLAMMNYILRAFKWHSFFIALRLKISLKESIWVSMSGLLMAVTPGKFGELWKSWLVRDLRGYDLSRTVPVVFADRITDIIAMLTLASFGAFVFNAEIASILLISGVLLSLIMVLRSKSIMLNILDRSRRFSGIREAYLGSLGLLSYRTLALTVLLSIAAWFMECVAFYLTFEGLSIEAGLLESTFIYAISSIAGALSMLPGGLGVTETSLAGLSGHIMKLDGFTAVAATLIIRAATLWFAVCIGAISYLIGGRLLYPKSQ